MGDLLHDLRKLDAESYQGYERAILKYALSLAEIIANDRQTRMTFEEFEQLPDRLEYSHGFIEPKHWSLYQERYEKLRASLREGIAARLQEFVRARGIGSVAMEGDAILVQGGADSGLLVILVDSGQSVKDYLARGAQVWYLRVFWREAVIYRNAEEQVLSAEDALEDPAVLPGFKLPLSEVFPELEGEKG